MSFDQDFVWGAATASYQIEGAGQIDGRGPCVWDMFCRKPGAVYESHNGDVACDHYHRYAGDIELMKELGIRGYRFSISWPRILPTGQCDVNGKGLDFYNRLVDQLLASGIEPWVTLFHWDYPLELYRQGGWLNPDSPKWFADYATVLAQSLGDRVTNWMTQNEPQCFIGLGLHTGVHAPGDKLRWDEVLVAMHHAMVGHGLATQALRASAKLPAKVGMAHACAIFMPETDSEDDRAAAHEATFGVETESAWNMAWWLDPVFFGKYPEDGVRAYGEKMPKFNPDDLKTMHQPLDFFGMNMYHGIRVRRGKDGKPEPVGRPIGAPVTALKWPVEPDCLYWGAKFFYERYGKPIIVTENGLSNQDWISVDGHVHDPQRIDYTHRHVAELKKAARDGVKVGGYFHWSLMDNFEWAEGYRERFGLIFVDYATQKRIPKDSYRWYQNVIRTNGADIAI